jgi:hypothetical protein
MGKHYLWEGYKESFPSIPHCYTRGSPRVKQPPSSGWKPSLRWWAPVSSHRSLHRDWGHGTAPLPGGSSFLHVSKESQERNLGMGSLVCLTNGDAPGPQVFCPRWSCRSCDLAWWSPYRTCLSPVLTVDPCKPDFGVHWVQEPPGKGLT